MITTLSTREEYILNGVLECLAGPCSTEVSTAQDRVVAYFQSVKDNWDSNDERDDYNCWYAYANDSVWEDEAIHTDLELICNSILDRLEMDDLDDEEWDAYDEAFYQYIDVHVGVD